jgi:hypothetical protein
MQARYGQTRDIDDLPEQKAAPCADRSGDLDCVRDFGALIQLAPIGPHRLRQVVTEIGSYCR